MHAEGHARRTAQIQSLGRWTWISKDKVAIVTGSSRGLGLASAKSLAAEGCRVCLCARGEARLRDAANEVADAAGDDVGRSGGDRRCQPVRRRAAWSSTGRRPAFGSIDILVNNVGFSGRQRAAGDHRRTSGSEAIDQTLFPAIRATRLVVPHMQRRGGGAIVIIASIFGREAGGRMTYNAVKAAEISLGKSLAQQLASSNIRVNSVSPGSILFEGGSWWRRQQAEPAAIAEFVRRELPFGALRPSRRSRRRRGVPLLTTRQLDQRDVDRGGRLSEPGVLTSVFMPPPETFEVHRSSSCG